MIRLLLLAFPSAWRRRYGAELADLVADEGLRPRLVADLLRAGLVERWRTARDAVTGGAPVVIGPAWRHPTGWALVAALLLAPTFLMVGFSLMAYELGVSSLRTLMEPVNDVLSRVRPLDLLLVVAPLAALLAALAPLLRVELRNGAGGREAVLGLRLRTLNLITAFAAVGVGLLLVGHIVVESTLQLGP